MSVAVAAVCWSGLSARISVAVIGRPYPSGSHEVVAELRGTLEDVDRPGRAIDAHTVAVVDALRRVLRPNDGRNAEFAREHGRMRRQAAGVGNEAGDLREQRDPGRIGHVADEDVRCSYF